MKELITWAHSGLLINCMGFVFPTHAIISSQTTLTTMPDALLLKTPAGRHPLTAPGPQVPCWAVSWVPLKGEETEGELQHLDSINNDFHFAVSAESRAGLTRGAVIRGTWGPCHLPNCMTSWWGASASPTCLLPAETDECYAENLEDEVSDAPVRPGWPQPWSRAIPCLPPPAHPHAHLPTLHTGPGSGHMPGASRVARNNR